MFTFNVKQFNSMFNKAFNQKMPVDALSFNDERLLLQKENAQLLHELFEAKKQLKELRESIEETRYL